MKTYDVVCIGGGPAGLTAAYELAKSNKSVCVLEADPQYWGGISRTVEHKGFRYDIGGHRFFSKSSEVEALWTEILGADMLDRPRSSRIFYRSKFFSYPLKPFEALMKLGVIESVLCVLSYVKAQIFPVSDPRNFRDWVTNKFGKRLFDIFFRTYTEKVWGMKCGEISADWAAQRIKGLSLFTAVWSAFRPKPRNRKETIKSLIDTFRYPRKGPGMMWERAAQLIQERGGEARLGHPVTRVEWNRTGEFWILSYKDLRTGDTGQVRAQHVISSAPIRTLFAMMNPRPKSLTAAASLKYRDFLTVGLVVKGSDRFDDNWIYVHEPGVQVGRIQNFKSWSPEMLPSPEYSSYGLEYFCFEGDALWSSSDPQLIDLAKFEIQKLGLVQAENVVDGVVIRQAKAYPVYDENYAAHIAEIRKEIQEEFPGLHLVGRNGMHKYNNQDHAMMTALLTARNIVAGREVYDVWLVNQDAEYHEAGDRGAESLRTELNPKSKAA